MSYRIKAAVDGRTDESFFIMARTDSYATEGIEGAIAEKKVTYDFDRLMDNATLMSCSQFGDAIIENM